MGGRIMVISGTRSGIGRGMALYFVSRGWSVAGCSRGPASFASAQYEHTSLDVSDEGKVRSWIRSVKNAHGSIDVAVANAGVVQASSLMMATPGKLLESVLRTNICGTYYVCREAAKVMAVQRSGRIVALSSMAAGLHEEGSSAYSASKAAISEMARVLAREVAPLGITCNVVAPSIVDTEAVEALGGDVENRALQALTIKRKLTIPEICHVVEFLAAAESSSITGQTIYMGLVV